MLYASAALEEAMLYSALQNGMLVSSLDASVLLPLTEEPTLTVATPHGLGRVRRLL